MSVNQINPLSKAVEFARRHLNSYDTLLTRNLRYMNIVRNTKSSTRIQAYDVATGKLIETYKSMRHYSLYSNPNTGIVGIEYYIPHLNKLYNDTITPNSIGEIRALIEKHKTNIPNL